MSEDLPWVPEACTLPSVEQPLRVAEFDELFATAVRRAERLSPTRLRLMLDGSTAAVAHDLAARETACCSFFTFAIDPIGDELRIDIGVPAAYVAVLDALAGRAGAARPGAA